MDFTDFFASLREPQPPKYLTTPLKALWHDAQGDWTRAHDLVNDLGGPEAAWVHAYLHRKEGDQGNANYWYRQAKQETFEGNLEQEWREMVVALLRKSGRIGKPRHRRHQQEEED